MCIEQDVQGAPPPGGVRQHASVRRIPAIAWGLVLAGGIGMHLAGRAEPVAAQYGVQRVADYQVTFEFSQDATGFSSSPNQITILFANRSVEGPTPPKPFFGDDIVQEFSFSARDVVKGQIRFTRRVADKSFLDARYIRVVNYGGEGWGGDTISLTVDGEDIFKREKMQPRKGATPGRAFQDFNPKNWPTRSYWEAELRRFRVRTPTKGS